MELDFNSADDLANALQLLEQDSPDFFDHAGTIVDFTLPGDAGPMTNPAALDTSCCSDWNPLQHHQQQSASHSGAGGVVQPPLAAALHAPGCHLRASPEESPEPAPPGSRSDTSSPMDFAALPPAHAHTHSPLHPAAAAPAPTLHVQQQTQLHVETFGAAHPPSSASPAAPHSTAAALSPEMLQALEVVRTQGTAAPRAAKALAWRAYRIANLDPTSSTTVTTTTIKTERTLTATSSTSADGSPAPDVNDLMASSSTADSPMSGASPVPLHGADAEYSPPRAAAKTNPGARHAKGNISKKLSSARAVDIVTGAGLKPARKSGVKTAASVNREDVIAGADAVAADASAAVLASKASLAKLAAQISHAKSAEEKAKLKKLKNREAAQLSRNIQREYVTSLESRVEHLAREKSDLESEMTSLKSGYASMADEMSQVKALLKKFMGGGAASTKPADRGSAAMDPPPAYSGENFDSILGSGNTLPRSDGAMFHQAQAAPRAQAAAMAASAASGAGAGFGGSAARSGAFAGAGVAFFVIFFAFGIMGNPAANNNNSGNVGSNGTPPWVDSSDVQRIGGKGLLGYPSSSEEPCVCPCYCDSVCVPPGESAEALEASAASKLRGTTGDSVVPSSPPAGKVLDDDHDDEHSAPSDTDLFEKHPVDDDSHDDAHHDDAHHDDAHHDDSKLDSDKDHHEQIDSRLVMNH